MNESAAKPRTAACERVMAISFLGDEENNILDCMQFSRLVVVIDIQTKEYVLV